MTMRTKYKRAYRIYCDGCGDIGPERLYASRAKALATEQGWHLGCPEGDLCPYCVRKLDDEDAAKDHADEQESKALVRAGVG